MSLDIATTPIPTVWRMKTLSRRELSCRSEVRGRPHRALQGKGEVALAGTAKDGVAHDTGADVFEGLRDLVRRVDALLWGSVSYLE